MATEGSDPPSSGSAQPHAYYKACEIESSDDGSSVMSESEHEHFALHTAERNLQSSSENSFNVSNLGDLTFISLGRRPSASSKYRKGSSNSSQLSPSLSGCIQHPPGSPLASYPVSIRQQLAMIKMMEQNANESGGGASHHGLGFGSSSPHSLNVTPRSRRVPKVHKKNDHGETPLHVSARKGECRQCKKLLQEGAVVNATDYAGWTPLHEACAHARFKVAKILISNGADVDAASNNGDTPLHDAATRGCEKLVWLLLHSGADRDKTNHGGKKPIDVCPPHCSSVRALLGSSTVPEKCPSGGDSNDTSPVDHHVEIRHPLTISIGPPSVSSVKQPTPSPAETETTIHSETCLQGETSDFHHGSDLPGLEEKEQHENLESDMERTMTQEREKLSGQVEISEVEAEALKNTQEANDSQSSETATLQRRPFWGSDEVTTAKNDEALEAEAEDGDQDGVMQHEEEPSGTEPRRWVRTRGTPRKIAICQEKPPAFNDKRKQRGRRRGKVTTPASRSLALPQASTSEDVYEFHDSPEREGNDNSQIELMEDSGLSPEAKRQRLEGGLGHPQSTGSSAKQDDKRQIELSEGSKPSANANETGEESNGSRKVPPLRILLPRTPSEDNPTTITADEVASVAAATRNGSKRNARVPKNQIKKEPTPEDSATPPPADNGMHRMTRSRVRQAGRTIKDEVASVGFFESSVKRRGQNGARRMGVPSVSGVSSPMLTCEKEENADSAGDSAIFNGNVNSSEDGNSLGAIDGPATVAMSLMKKNTYDGFRGLRARIEQFWIDTLSQPGPNRAELPANYEDYMIVKKEFTLKNNVDYNKLGNRLEVNLKLSPELQDLRKSQEEKRLRMEIKHKIERERLQMLAEREVLRMLNRKANPEREFMSVVRMQHESDIYNAWYLKERSEDHPIIECEEVKTKFREQVRLMENRQKMESDALFAEQVYTWNSVLRNVSHLSMSTLRDKVPKVSITHLDLKL